MSLLPPERRPQRPPTPNDFVDWACLFVPWLVLFSKKAKYSFIELWLFIMCWGFSAGPLLSIACLSRRGSGLGVVGFLILEYIAFHAHCACFMAVVDTLSWRQGLARITEFQRRFFILVSQFLVVFIFYCISEAVAS